MEAESTNWLRVCDSTVANLNKAANKAVWFQHPPASSRKSANS
jgi:hypothetical protein